MGLMPIIFTALGIFIAASAVILLVSYLMYKIRPKQKPYIEIRAEKPIQSKKSYYTVPVYETSVRKSIPTPVSKQAVRYRDVNRFEVLNQQKPRYMQTSESRVFTGAINVTPQQNIYEYYSSGYNDHGFRAVTP